MAFRVLIVGGPPAGRRPSREILVHAGFTVSESPDFDAAAVCVSDSPPHAIVVEASTDESRAVTFADGIERCSRAGKVPILILRAGDDPSDCGRRPFVSCIPASTSAFSLLRELAHLTKPRGVIGHPAAPA